MAELNIKIEQYKEKLFKFKCTFQPIVGVVEGSTYYLILDEIIKYRFDSLTEAIDSSFKMVFCTSLKYQAECSHIYTFLQKYIYKINLKEDIINTVILKMAHDLVHN